MYIGSDAFVPAVGREASKTLFKKSVLRVEIETHSYCNRRCPYCPNAVGDRLGENVRMEEATWQRILSDLAEIGYASHVVFNSYNEPLADPMIMQRIREARAALPAASLQIYSNGDYLKAAMVDELAAAGLTALNISVHLGPNEKYGDLLMLNKFAALMVRIGRAVRFENVAVGKWVVATVPHPNLKIEMRGVNYFQEGNRRGDLVSSVKLPAPRTAPCYFPFAHFYVGYGGNIVPCCHIRSDAAAHQPYVIGNVRDFGSIFEAFASERAVAWRRHLISLEEKKEPCRSCSVSFLSAKPEDLDRLRKIHREQVLDRPLPGEERSGDPGAETPTGPPGHPRSIG